MIVEKLSQDPIVQSVRKVWQVSVSTLSVITLPLPWIKFVVPYDITGELISSSNENTLEGVQLTII